MNIEIDGQIVEIDENCVEIVILLNKIGLTTIFCCEGHEEDMLITKSRDTKFYVMFDENVTDEMITTFYNKVNLDQFLDSSMMVTKWYRFGMMNWALDWYYNLDGKNKRMKEVKKLCKIIKKEYGI